LSSVLRRRFGVGLKRKARATAKSKPEVVDRSLPIHGAASGLEAV
jgi:hypothetical protein